MFTGFGKTYGRAQYLGLRHPKQDYLVRIDHMADGSFRHEAWKDKDDMVDAPNIVAEGGSFSKPGNVFKSEDYSYAVIDQLLRTAG